MDHDLAIKNNTAERYLLGELTETEIEEYEEHFFSCPACAQEVKLGSDFVVDAREVFKTDFKPEPMMSIEKSMAWGRFWSSMRQPAPTFAVIALAVVSGFSIYQNAVIAGLQKPEISMIAAAILRNARAEANGVVLARRNEAVHIPFEIPAAEFASYEVDILNESGARKLPNPVPVSAQAASETIDLRVPAGTLEAGKYMLVIQGVNSNTAKSQAGIEVVRYPFELQFQN